MRKWPIHLKFVVPVVSLIDMCSGLVLISHARRHVEKRELIYVLAGVAVGVVIGVTLLHSMDSGALKRFFGVIVILFALKILFQDYFSAERLDSRLGSVFGALGGITGALFSTNGPPITFYLEHQVKEKQALRATILAALLAGSMWRNTLYLATGIFEMDMLWVVLAMVPVLLVGSYIGTHAHLKVKEEAYRKAVGGILLVSGALLMM